MANQRITTYCPDDTMGEMTDDECDFFRATLFEQLQVEYPRAKITVSREGGTDFFDGFDGEEEEIHDFIRYVWDNVTEYMTCYVKQ